MPDHKQEYIGDQFCDKVEPGLAFAFTFYFLTVLPCIQGWSGTSFAGQARLQL